MIHWSQDPNHDYAQTIARTAAMVRDAEARRLCEARGLEVRDVTWEDTARFKGSCVGPNISDLTIQVQHKEPREQGCRLTCMPVIRPPNFSDISADVALDRFYLLTGNEKGHALQKTPLREVLDDPRKYLSDPDSWPGETRSLLCERDTHVLASAQACFLPIPKSGKAQFNPVLFNYQSIAEAPAVLTVLATREGASMTVIDNERDPFEAGDSWGQRLFFNANGQRASLTGERVSDFSRTAQEPGAADTAEAPETESGLNLVLLVQIPLKQPFEPDSALDTMMFSACESMVCEAEPSDVEEAAIGHGEVEGPFTEIDGHAIERDERFPIRVTVQFYQATSNGVVDAADIARIAAQIDRVYHEADYVGSLVTEEPGGRPTEHQGPRQQPPHWWEAFWRDYEAHTGKSRAEAIALLRKIRPGLDLEDPDALKDALRPDPDHPL